MLQISSKPQRKSTDKTDLCQEGGRGGQRKLHGLAFLLSVPRLCWGHGGGTCKKKSNGGKFLQITLNK